MCFIFFFKQKTAYEMRISDWSSDVCSSDLVLPRMVRLGVLDGAAHRRVDAGDLRLLHLRADRVAVPGQALAGHDRTSVRLSGSSIDGTGPPSTAIRGGVRPRMRTGQAAPAFSPPRPPARQAGGEGRRGSVPVTLGG